ncbi:hypothetical protein C8R43DRAFT_1136275 [Mycena crocata]|nr:hypothetical protein C8R43DRAFT_1136275 [Mycena crocata]
MSAPHHSNSGTPLNLNAPIQLAEVLQSTQPQGILRNSESPLRTVTRSRYQAFFAQHRVHLKFFKSESEGWPRLWVATQIEAADIHSERGSYGRAASHSGSSRLCSFVIIALPSLEFLKIAITSSPSVPFPRIASGWGCMKPSSRPHYVEAMLRVRESHNVETMVVFAQMFALQFIETHLEAFGDLQVIVELSNTYIKIQPRTSISHPRPEYIQGITPSIILFFGIRGRSGISDNYYGNIEYTTYRVPASGLKCQEKTAGDQRGAAFQAMRRVLLAILGFSDEICSCERDRALEKKTARGKRPASLASRRIQPPAIGLVFCAPRSRRAAAAVTSTLNSNLRDPFSSLADQDSVQVKLKSKAAPQLPLPPFWIRQRAPTAARISLRVDVARISNRRRGVLRLDAQDFQSKSTPRRVCMAAFRIRPALAPDLDPTGSRLVPHARDETPVGELRSGYSRRRPHTNTIRPVYASQRRASPSTWCQHHSSLARVRVLGQKSVRLVPTAPVRARVMFAPEPADTRVRGGRR